MQYYSPSPYITHSHTQTHTNTRSLSCAKQIHKDTKRQTLSLSLFPSPPSNSNADIVFQPKTSQASGKCPPFTVSFRLIFLLECFQTMSSHCAATKVRMREEVIKMLVRSLELFHSLRRAINVTSNQL